MDAKPTIKNIISTCILGLCLVAGALTLLHGERVLPASGTAVLDNEYTVSQRRSSTYYEVKYSFSVNGTQYRGSDTLYTEPDSQNHIVYYDPKDPNENSLKKNPVDGKKIVIAIVIFVCALIAYATLPINPASAVPQSVPETQTGIGDAAGEYLSMEGGRYPATFYVGIAFIGQVAFISSLLWGGCALVPGTPVPADFGLALSVACGLLLTLFVYWDRWKCTTVYSSRFCSGCANISVIYVPMVAFFYANWRGLMKLTGR